MVVLVDYMLAPLGQSLQDSPQVVEALKQGMLVGTADAVQFQNAPIYMKEALTFPYRYGIDFIADMLTKGGKDKAFTALFQNPPRTTRQIMEPQTYLAGSASIRCRFPTSRKSSRITSDSTSAPSANSTSRFSLTSMREPMSRTRCIRTGEEATTMQPGPREIRRRRWRLIYVSRWSDQKRRPSLPGSTPRPLPSAICMYMTLPRMSRPARNGNEPHFMLPRSEKLSGKHTWLTEDGPVVIEVEGDTILISESVDQPATEKLEQEFSQPCPHPRSKPLARRSAMLKFCLLEGEKLAMTGENKCLEN